MARLSPVDQNLADTALALVKRNSSGEAPLVELVERMENHQIGLDDSLRSLSNIVHCGTKDDATKLAALKTVLQMHRVIDTNDNVAPTTPVINFIFNDSNVNINGIFNPQREKDPTVENAKKRE